MPTDNFVKAKADADGHFALDVEADKMCLYTAFLEEQYQHGSWRYGNFLVENKATVKLLFDDNTWKVTSGGREQMLKVKMDAEAEKLYLGRMEEISNQAKKEILPIVEELQKQGKTRSYTMPTACGKANTTRLIPCFMLSTTWQTTCAIMPGTWKVSIMVS